MENLESFVVNPRDKTNVSGDSESILTMHVLDLQFGSKALIPVYEFLLAAELFMRKR